ncbi:MAG TPA: hypothetical protein VEO95_03285 [Chthoniobacteraceae bacterium]|nr:hypothetical protein [Chthoniobacteraceae bacterium]
MHREHSVALASVIVDTGSEFTWVEARLLEQIGVKVERKDQGFVMANGQFVSRNIGYAIIQVGPHFTVDEVVFGQPGDQTLLGARTMEGLGFVIDLRTQKIFVSRSRLAASWRPPPPAGTAATQEVPPSFFAGLEEIQCVPGIYDLDRAKDPITGELEEVPQARASRRRSRKSQRKSRKPGHH